MLARSPRFIIAGLVLCATLAQAKDLRITLPKRSKPTPVQKLNQDGVKAVQKQDYDKAKKLFYKAYLIDPNDPFTLNNLGYIAELEGEIERAQRFYQLAAENESDAVVYRASSDSAEGKPVAEVAGSAADVQMQINRYNVEAMGLIMKDRAPEADLVLQKALALDSKNPFTMNNLGFAREKEGEFQDAMKYYNTAAASGSNEPVVVTLNRDWRGKPISEVASENARKLQRLISRTEDTRSQVARLNLRGVSAINRNEKRKAREYFEHAYKLDESNAFTLNNMGYLAELDGDRETADYYYAKAREADLKDARVTVATRRDAEGQKVGEVADVNGQIVNEAFREEIEAKRRQGGPIVLRRRDNTPVMDPPTPQSPSTSDQHQQPAPPQDQAPTQEPTPQEQQ